MNVSTQIPPIYQRCRETFGVDWDDGIAIAWKNTIYSKYPLGLGVEHHEEVHLVQQEKYESCEGWWEQYLTDPAFRLDQEIAAYQAQARFLRGRVSRDEYARRIHQLAKDLSSAMYGKMCTFSEAKRILAHE